MADFSSKNYQQHRLEISELVVTRSEIPLFSPINFTLKSGESLQIRGANGAGKTTLLRAICGLCHSHDGRILWDQNGIEHPENPYYDKLLYLGHALGLKSKLTAEQNLSFYRHLRFTPDPQLIRQALSQTGVGEYFDELIARMSAGQKRRVALARIITEPVPLWILDEPLVALDIQGQAWLQTQCNQHLARGGMLIITSHQPITGIDGLQELTIQ